MNDLVISHNILMLTAIRSLILRIFIITCIRFHCGSISTRDFFFRNLQLHLKKILAVRTFKVNEKSKML